MQKFLLANWKSNMSRSQALAWIAAFRPWWLTFSSAHKELQFVLCPSVLHLSEVQHLFPEIRFGGQLVSPFPAGSYTGAVHAAALKEYAEYVLVGHVERRTFFHEDEATVGQQLAQALDAGLKPIVAVDASTWSSRLTQLPASALEQSLVLYEPADAISVGEQLRPANPVDVASVVADIRRYYPGIGVIYGGSVTPATLPDFMSVSALDGVGVGSASLDVEMVKTLCQQLVS